MTPRIHVPERTPALTENERRVILAAELYQRSKGEAPTWGRAQARLRPRAWPIPARHVPAEAQGPHLLRWLEEFDLEAVAEREILMRGFA